MEYQGEIIHASDPRYQRIWRELHPTYDKDHRQATYARRRAWEIKHRAETLDAYNEYNRERSFQRRLKKFGLTNEQYETLFEKGCAACGAPLVRGVGGAAMDHNHKTGKFRGILCAADNQALGLVQDNPDRLRQLIAYLDENETSVSEL